MEIKEYIADTTFTMGNNKIKEFYENFNFMCVAGFGGGL